MPSSSCSRRSQRRSSLRTRASSAPNGSSSSSTRGSTASARASATRWRWPPESCDGMPPREPLELHQLEQLVHALLDLAPRPGARARPHAQAERDVLEHGHVAEQRVVLEHEADARGRARCARWRPRRRTSTCPRRRLEPGDDAQQRRLARARRAEQRDQLALLDVAGSRRAAR